MNEGGEVQSIPTAGYTTVQATKWVEIMVKEMKMKFIYLHIPTSSQEMTPYQ